MSRSAPAPMRIAPPPEAWTAPHARPSRRSRAATKSQDRPIAAMVFGILSLVFNPLLLPSLIGVLYGARSLRAGTTRRAQAIVGIVCGAVGGGLLVMWVVLTVVLRLVLPGLMADGLERSIIDAAAAQGGSISAVRCPPVHDFDAGDSVTCTGSVGGETVSIVATCTEAGPVQLRFVRAA